MFGLNSLLSSSACMEL